MKTKDSPISVQMSSDDLENVHTFFLLNFKFLQCKKI